MLRRRLALVVVAGAVSFGGGAAFAATHGAAQPAKKPVRAPQPVTNVHYPCHDHAARLTPAQV